MPIRFLRFELDPETYRLTRDAVLIPLRPKAFDLLAYLVANRDRVVPRDELVRVVWGHTNVGPGSLSGLVNELRTALGEPAGESGSIRTVHARGYQFVAAVAQSGAEGFDGGRRSASREPTGGSPAPALREALSEALRRHGVSECADVAPLLDRLCEVAGRPARPTIRRVPPSRNAGIARLAATGTGDREDEEPR